LFAPWQGEPVKAGRHFLFSCKSPLAPAKPAQGFFFFVTRLSKRAKAPAPGAVSAPGLGPGAWRQGGGHPLSTGLGVADQPVISGGDRSTRRPHHRLLRRSTRASMGGRGRCPGVRSWVRRTKCLMIGTSKGQRDSNVESRGARHPRSWVFVEPAQCGVLLAEAKISRRHGRSRLDRRQNQPLTAARPLPNERYVRRKALREVRPRW